MDDDDDDDEKKRNWGQKKKKTKENKNNNNNFDCSCQLLLLLPSVVLCPRRPGSFCLRAELSNRREKRGEKVRSERFFGVVSHRPGHFLQIVFVHFDLNC